MIDLSHLTEEEQKAIMTVLSRDAELKRAEEERIRKLENVVNSGYQQPDVNMKYFTGEWFYEAKSRRHMDKIHGSEIIMASMKRSTSALDGSPRIERSKSASSLDSSSMPPPKPARTWDALQPQDINPNENEALQIRSPRTPRHNPFNRASLLVVDPPENTVDFSNTTDKQNPESRPAGSVTSDSSSAGFRPVPKKRTFVSRRSSTSDNVGPPPGLVPAPRRRPRNGSSGSSIQSNVKPQDNSDINVKATSPKQEVKSFQTFSTSGLEGDTPATRKNSSKDDVEERQDNHKLELLPVATGSSIHPSDGNVSSVGSASRQELSFTRSSVAAEPPVSYDLNFIDKADQQVPAITKQELRLSSHASKPIENEDDSITKVLDWFSRSNDSNDWLNDTEETSTGNAKDIKSEHVHRTGADIDTGTPSIPLEISKESNLNICESAPPQENKETQHATISSMKSFWEKSNKGPRILMSKSNSSAGKGEKGSSTTTNSGIHSNAPDRKEENNLKHPDENHGMDLVKANSPLQKDDHSILHLTKTQVETTSFVPTVNTNAISHFTEEIKSNEINQKIPESPLQAKSNLESEKLVPIKPSGLNSPKDQIRSLNEDRRHCGDRSPKSVAIKEKSPLLNRHVGTQDVPQKDKERIKNLKSFWEQERAKTGFALKSRLDNKGTSVKLSKRLAKSEFDMQLIGKGSDSEEDNRPTHIQSNQKAEKTSPSLGKRQFITLREFWHEAVSESKLSLSDNTRSPKHKEMKCGDSENNYEKSSVKQALNRPPPPPYRPKLTVEKQTGSKLESKPPNHLNNHNALDSAWQRDVRRSSKDSGKLAKTRRDSFSNSSCHMNSFRRAKSMFSLCTDETDPIQLDVSPVHSQSRKPRSNTEKGTGLRRHSEDTEALTPRARAFVPTDYRHYLGMTDSSNSHASPVPTPQDKWPKELKSGHDSSRRGSKTQQRPLSPNYSSSDTCQDSASESRSNSRLSSNRENDNDSPVRRALRRAEARPKNLARSLEDITAFSSPRAERRQELSVDQRSSSDGSSLPSPTLFKDPEHMKKMSKSVPSFLQKELSGSVMTMYSGDFGNVDVQGTIHFSIHYVQKLREFHIFVAQCKDLAPVDPKRGRSDPYVKSYLVPDKANLGKKKTAVKKKTLDPVFNEILRYRVRMEYLRTQTLILSVWHNDTFGKNSFLGEIDVDLSKWDFDHAQMNYLALKARTYPTLTPPNCRGEMRVAIRYVPQISPSDALAKAGSNSGEIHIWVKECKNLPMVRATIDPYVKCFVLPDTSKKSRQKTRVLRGTSDPVFNHTMVYDGIRQVDLTEACVELTVLDRDRLATNLLGGLRLGAGTGRSYGSLVDWMDSTPYEVALWERMLASPNEWIEDVLPLRWLHSTKTTSK
ncbi:unnamed protein product [Knipowitschia caucasica]